MISNAISETLKMNMANDPLDVQSWEKIDTILMQFYNQNLYKGTDEVVNEVASQNTATNKSQRPVSSEMASKVAAAQGQ